MRLAVPSPSSLPDVLRLLAEADLPTSDLSPDHLADFTLAEGDDGRLLGAVAVERIGTVGLLRSLVVAPAARGTGLGRRLVAHAESAAARDGVQTVYLLTTTAADFFARLGYHVVDRATVPEALQDHPEFAALCPASATCMTKLLH